MAYYKYTAYSKTGSRVSGIRFGADSDMVKSIVKSQGLVVDSIKETNVLGGKSVKSREITEVTSKMSTLLDSGFQLNATLSFVMKNTDNLLLQEVFYTVDKEVKEGKSFADSLKEYSKIFSNIYINMVNVGEKNGILDKVLQDLANFLEQRDEFRKHIKSALTYPFIMIFVLFASLFALLFFVVPEFSKMLLSLNTKLPALTKFLFNLSNWLHKFWYVPFLSLLGLFIILKLLFTNKRFYYWWSRNKLRIPIFGEFFLKNELLSFIRVMELSLERGMEFVEAFNGAKNVMNNKYIRNQFSEIYNRIKMGERLGNVFNDYQFLPAMFREMMNVGDESGNLSHVMKKLNTTYQKDIEDQLDLLLGLIEPIITLVMGVVIGGIVAAIMLPMLEAAGNMK